MNKYKIVGTLGKGAFGQVVHVKDVKTERSVALKMIKDDFGCRESAKYEVFNLKILGNIDPSGVHLCVKMLDSFNYRGHACIAFEKFGLSVHDFLKQNEHSPYDIDQIRHVAYQLCYAVKFLHKNKLTHTDLKPENVIFVNSDFDLVYDGEREKYVKRLRNTEIRLIDFGNAIHDAEQHGTEVTTRYYRAPEVILELGWGHQCDVWSIGCILFEMYLGKLLFQTNSSVQHLAMMERVLGKIPSSMVEDTRKAYFYGGKIGWKSLREEVKNTCKPLLMYKLREDDDHDRLFDLIRRMLRYEPSRRITSKRAMSHKFFSKIPAHQRVKN